MLSFSDRDLKRFYTRNDASGIRPDWVPRVRRILNVLDVALSLPDMAAAGMGFHPLKGDRKGDYSFTVSGNWRITFQWVNGDAGRIQLEDYHGS